MKGSRGHSTASSAVSDSTTISTFLTTTVAAKVSAGLFLGSATAGVYGADGVDLWIESA